MTIRKIGILFLTVSILWGDLFAIGEEWVPFKIIVNPSKTIPPMGIDEVSQLFLKKNTTWGDKQSVLPVDLTGGNSVRVAFSNQILKKSISAVKAYWQQKIFSGRDVPPPEFASEKEVILYVKSHLGAIGYISAETPAEGVTVVKVIP